MLFFAFDNIDIIAGHYGADIVQTFYKKFCGEKNAETQVVVTSRTWNPILTKFIKNIRNPMLLIGSALEAALYGELKIDLQISTGNGKLRNLIGE